MDKDSFYINIVRKLSNTGVSKGNLNFVKQVILVFISAIICIGIYVIAIEKNIPLFISLIAFLFINICTLLVINKLINTDINQGNDMSEIKDVNYREETQAPSKKKVALACFVIFFICYLLFNAISTIFEMDFDETSLTYTLFMIGGYILTYIIFSPLCRKYLK